MKKFALIVLLPILILGCGTTSFVMESYKGRKIADKKLGIFLKDYHVSNKKDVEDDLGEGNPKDVFFKHFNTNFPLMVAGNANFTSAGVAFHEDLSDLEEKKFPIGDDHNIYMDVPLDNNVFKTDSTYFDFILVVDDLEVRRIDGESGTAVMGANGMTMSAGGKSARLSMEFEYYIWDNAEKRMVSYGEFDSTNNFLFAMTIDTWNNTLNKMAKDIILKSPFENEMTQF